MEENLLDGNLNERQIRLLEEADSFDLEDFYLRKGPSTGAVCLITKNQMLITDCYIKENSKRSYGTHRKTADDIYKAIYGIGIAKIPYWESQIIEDGNIIMELCCSFPSVIHIPNELSGSQRTMLTNFVNRINNIINNNDFFKDNPQEFILLIGENQEISCTNELNTLLEEINRNKRR